jgi:hypothetical protein
MDLPAKTGMLVRMDSTITVPGSTATNTGYISSR